MVRHTRTLLGALVAVALASSLSGAQAVETTQDRALAKLQARLSKNPNNFAAIRDVGFKLYELKRFAEARPLLVQAQAMRPRDGLSALYAGLSAEELKDYSAARAAYNKYLEFGKDRRTKSQINARIVAISREELKQSAAAAVANEQALRGQQVDGQTVAVLPFRCACDSLYKPLERGLAELVVTDLSISKQLRVLERDRMQAIADEIRLSAAGSVDAQTATRAGKLIQAGRILNGSINIATGTANPSINMTGSIVNTNDSQILPGTPTANGLLQTLFDHEKQFVLSVFNSMSVTLTAAEQALFRTRPTQNINAFLAFSRGLMAQDAGRLDEAQQLFESAQRQDPGFGAALQRAQQTAQAQQVSTASVDQSVRSSTEGQAVTNASTGTTSLVTTNVVLASVVADVNPTATNTAQNNTTQSGGGSGGSSSGGSTAPPTSQNTVAQATGTDQPAQRTGQVTIVIKRP